MIVIMAMERVTSLVTAWRERATAKHFCLLLLALTAVAFAFSIPLAVPAFPVQVFHYRFLCGIGNQSPLAYNIVEILVYFGTLIFLLICFGFILKKGNEPRSLPVKPQDYERFIMETRAIQESLILGKLVMFVTMAYVILQGPFIVMTFIVQIANSWEISPLEEEEYAVPQDADTLITWLRFFFPLVMPLIILACCQDIWTKVTNLVCCRRSTMGTTGSWASQGAGRPKSSTPIVPNNVLTLVATSEGLQLRLPENNYQRPPPNMPMEVVSQPQRIIGSRAMLPENQQEPPSPMLHQQQLHSEPPRPMIDDYQPLEEAKKSNMYGKAENVVIKATSTQQMTAVCGSSTIHSKQKKTTKTTVKKNSVVEKEVKPKGKVASKKKQNTKAAGQKDPPPRWRS
uniref:G_PROTEIN_RECEP_F1_2 domain-containing protein n=1 Tax=Panagrellus redivivus TaxID=6233 RepID=A0A7E4VKG3_PANRE